MVNPGNVWKDVRMRTRDGHILETRWMNIRLNQDSQVGIGLDMTEIYRLQEDLRQSQKMQAIGTLAGGIAHDFNNILASIIGFTEMAAEDVTDRPEVVNNLSNVLKSAVRAKELVKQILTFSRKSTYKREYISLTPIFKEILRLLRASIPANIDLRLSITSADDTVFAAPVEIQQIIMNLATNAYLAMSDQGGSIEIGLSDIDFDPGSTSFHDASREYIQMIVKDTGSGMLPEVMRRIFEPFYTTREPGQGTGMGLAVVYGIVRDLQGSISVESKVGSGSIFHVFLPKTIKDESMPKAPETQVVGGNERILFVDDELFLVELAKASLGKLGYAVTGVMDGKEAIKVFSAAPTAFDLVITDQAMPSLTGKELAERILTIRPDMPIILCTGHSETFPTEMAQEMGIKAYLTKPVDKQEMGRVVRSVLDKHYQ